MVSPPGGTAVLNRMERDPPDEAEAEEVFDHELTRVLQEHGDALEERSRTLLTTGAVSIASLGVIVHAKLRFSRWRWRGLLEVATEDPLSGEVGHSYCITISEAGRDRASLVQEITIHLAFEIAHRQ